MFKPYKKDIYIYSRILFMNYIYEVRMWPIGTAICL